MKRGEGNKKGGKWVIKGRKGKSKEIETKQIKYIQNRGKER